MDLEWMILSTTTGPTVSFTPNKPAYLCDSIFLRILGDICTFQGEDTPPRSYIWDNSWLQSHKNTWDIYTAGLGGGGVQSQSIYDICLKAPVAK